MLGKHLRMLSTYEVLLIQTKVIFKLKSTVREHRHCHFMQLITVPLPWAQPVESKDTQEKLRLYCVQTWQSFCPSLMVQDPCLLRHVCLCHRKLLHPGPRTSHGRYESNMGSGLLSTGREGAGSHSRPTGLTSHVPLHELSTVKGLSKEFR